MPVPDFPTGVPPWATFEDLKGHVSMLAQRLTNLMLNLDSLNVVRLDAGTVQIYDLKGGTGTITLDGSGMTVNNGSFDTFKVGINGDVTMTSATIQTENGYPKVVMDPSSNLLGAYLDANNYFEIQPSDPGTGAPTLNWVAGGSTTLQQFVDTSETRLRSIGRDLVLETSSSGNIVLQPEVANSVVLPSLFATLLANTGLTLQDSFDAKATKGVATGSAGAASLNGGIPPGTVLMVSGGGTVTWGGINVPNHTHTQT